MKFTEVNPFSKKIQKAINKSILNTIKNKDFILGKDVKKFEEKFSKLAKSKYAVGCATGTDALTLTLMALQLKQNDEVIVPGLTYISTGLAVILNNNKLVLADIDDQTGLIDIDKIKTKITKNTKAIIPVNLYGQKVDLVKLRRAVGRKISIIEDSAQSHFALYDKENKPRQSNISVAACYSFYPAKNLGAYGDGGLVSTNNSTIYKKLLALRNLGSIEKYKHSLIGLNSRLDTIQAAVLKEKLNSILILNEKRRKVSNYYDKILTPIKQIKLTKTSKGSSRHLYVIRTKRRNELIKYLAKKKIYCIIHYPYSLNKLAAFRKKVKETKLKNSENWAKQCISLPLHPNLTINDIRRVGKEINNFFKRK
tara:strand:- start:35 stop:1135 length:1101 start_codon:yes stop_codon:yes gene_type:complete